MKSSKMYFDHSFLLDDGDTYLCRIYDEEKWVGHCKYYRIQEEYDEVCIEYIHIDEKYRMRGYATAMVKELQSKYGLRWDYSFTVEGRKWYDALVKKGVVSV